MEAVENLMVGKQAHPQVVVGKALMEGFLYWGEGYSLPPTLLSGSSSFIKNIAQALLLFRTVGQDVQRIALKKIVFEGARKHIEVLMEQWLGRDMESNDGIGRSRWRVTDIDPPETCSLLGKASGRQQLTFALHLLLNLPLLHLRLPLHALRQGLR